MTAEEVDRLAVLVLLAEHLSAIKGLTNLAMDNVEGATGGRAAGDAEAAEQHRGSLVVRCRAIVTQAERIRALLPDIEVTHDRP